MSHLQVTKAVKAQLERLLSNTDPGVEVWMPLAGFVHSEDMLLDRADERGDAIAEWISERQGIPHLYDPDHLMILPGEPDGH